MQRWAKFSVCFLLKYFMEVSIWMTWELLSYWNNEFYAWIVIMDLVSLRYSWEELYFIINHRNDLPVFCVLYFDILVHYLELEYSYVCRHLHCICYYLEIIQGFSYSHCMSFASPSNTFCEVMFQLTNSYNMTKNLLRLVVNWLKEGLFQGKLLISGS